MSRMPQATTPTPEVPCDLVDSLGESLTPTQAAQMLRVSPPTIYRWIDEGLIPARRVGKRMLRVNRSDLALLVTDVSRPS